ncbi:hypothetical protein HPP92_008666 [Vanilla planifolia]|uniref:Uncharacterized protein n=1 Tax=Vanilla planifolia TaxID=51239 RepID=A0A835RER6_VANPL|nr:hypothetical protein HPP92_008666 [Vanilla planifolia]
MASSLTITFRPPMIRASSGSGRERKRRTIGAGGGGGAWFAPLFGWGSDTDYIDCGEATSLDMAAAAGADHADQRPKCRFTGFTEEKARELRMRMMETESFHDAMYHSAIAARLASNVRRRSGSDH